MTPNTNATSRPQCFYSQVAGCIVLHHRRRSQRGGIAKIDTTGKLQRQSNHV